MAHELGHLLLPHGSHAKSGIMTAAWDRKQMEQIGRGWLSFTKEQAEAIRARVSDLPQFPKSLITYCGHSDVIQSALPSCPYTLWQRFGPQPRRTPWPGTKILSSLGAGGMGEVYRATVTKLPRERQTARTWQYRWMTRTVTRDE